MQLSINPPLDQPARPITIITLMGVSGCGKTTVGTRLAERLGWEFVESDAYHSKEEIEKMANGIPLTDDDRLPWLKRLHGLLVDKSKNHIPVIHACSALKEAYRKMLYAGLDGCVYVYLNGDYDLILGRMKDRDHFMKPSMLRSQFDALEEPSDALIIPITNSVDTCVQKIIDHFAIG